MNLIKIAPVLAALNCIASIDLGEFLQKPPETGEIACRIDNPVGQPYFCLFRWQPDASFIRIGPVAEEVFGDGEFQYYERGDGYCDGVVWMIYRESDPNTQTLYKVETPDSPEWSLPPWKVGTEGGRILSLGLDIPFGLKPELVEKDVLRWVHGPTNKPTMIDVCRLIRNEQGLVERIESTRWFDRKDSPKEMKYQSTLEYDTSDKIGSILLRVKHVVIAPPRQNPNLDGFTYYRMALNVGPMPKEKFLPRLPPGAQTVIIRGKTKWLETPTGLVPMPEIDPAIVRRVDRQQRMQENPIFYYFGAAIVLGCAVAFAVAWRRRLN